MRRLWRRRPRSGQTPGVGKPCFGRFRRGGSRVAVVGTLVPDALGGALRQPLLHDSAMLPDLLLRLRQSVRQQLCGDIDDRNNALVSHARGADHAERADHLAVDLVRRHDHA